LDVILSVTCPYAVLSAIDLSQLQNLQNVIGAGNQMRFYRIRCCEGVGHLDPNIK